MFKKNHISLPIIIFKKSLSKYIFPDSWKEIHTKIMVLWLKNTVQCPAYILEVPKRLSFVLFWAFHCEETA